MPFKFENPGMHKTVRRKIFEPLRLLRRSRRALAVILAVAATRLACIYILATGLIISEKRPLSASVDQRNGVREMGAAPSDRCPNILSAGLDYTLPFPVFYINMDSSTARRERMEADFGPYSWDLRRVPAVDGGDAVRLVELMGQKNYDRIRSYVSEDRSPNTVNQAELGCVLSHLVAIRRAYLEGHEVAMIAEDDITPLFMPFWTASVRDLVAAADTVLPPDKEPWDLIQLSWIWGLNEELYDDISRRIGGPADQLVRTRFQFGTSAYVVSRSGMAKIMDAFFTDETPAGIIRLDEGGRQAELYVSTASNILVTVPSLFPIEGSDTTISTGEEEERRLRSHRESNSIHAKAVLDLFRAAMLANPTRAES